MKKVVFLFVFIIISLSLVSCGGPSKVVEEAFVSLKDQDYTRLQTYFADKKLNNSLNTDEAVKVIEAEKEENKSEALGLLLDNLNFEILSHTINEDKTKATVKVKLDLLDTSDLIAKVFKAAVSEVFKSVSDSSPSQSKNGSYEHILIDILNNGDLKRTQKEVEIRLVKVKETWLIEGYDTFTSFAIEEITDILK